MYSSSSNFSSSSRSKDQNYYLACMAEAAERWDEMRDFMKKVVSSPEVTKTERNSLSIAYKNCIGQRRKQRKELAKIVEREESKNSKYLAILKDYKKRLENDIIYICNEITQLLDTYLIPGCKVPEDKVFYLKMKGDYNRYISELAFGIGFSKNAQFCQLAYNDALEIAQFSLKPTNPIYLGVILNYSVFYHEHMKSTKKAYELAREIYNKASELMDKIDDAEYDEAYPLMKQIKENLTSWEAKCKMQD